jgi:hypothetical protein
MSEKKEVSKPDATSISKDKISQMSAFGLSIGSSKTMGQALVEKMKPEQIPDFFKHIENRDKIEAKENLWKNIIYFIIFLVIILFFAFVIMTFKDTALTEKIIIGVVSFLGGGGIGYGLKSRQNQKS